MKLNFAGFVWIVFMILLFVVGWKERDTVPLRWSGTHPLGRLLALASLAVIGVGYIWWANRRISSELLKFA